VWCWWVGAWYRMGGASRSGGLLGCRSWSRARDTDSAVHGSRSGTEGNPTLRTARATQNSIYARLAGSAPQGDRVIMRVLSGP